MSHSVRPADYRTAFTTPGTRGPVLTALLGRFPVAMVPLSALFYVQQETGSFAAAGSVSAAILVGIAVGSVTQGRAVDRFGASRPLLVVTACFAVLVVALVMAVESSAATVVPVLIAAGIGASQSTIGSINRTMWTRLLPPGPVLEAALTYEALITEVYFILGPALAGLLLLAPWAGTGLTVAAGCLVAGTLAYASTRTIRGLRPEPTRAPTTGLLGVLRDPGLATVALASLGLGVVLGFVEVAVPAAAIEAGRAPLGGLLLALWSVSSALAGAGYGLRPWPAALSHRVPVLLGLFAILVGLASTAPSLGWLAVALLVAGALITPQAAAHASAVGMLIGSGRVTEAFGWVITAATLGLGLGQLFSALIVARTDGRVAFLVAAVLGLGLAGLVHRRRDTLTRRDAIPVLPG
ncbi:MAG TPA: MFS transporter [Micromonosporaceae bacterium]